MLKEAIQVPKLPVIFCNWLQKTDYIIIAFFIFIEILSLCLKKIFNFILSAMFILS